MSFILLSSCVFGRKLSFLLMYWPVLTKLLVMMLPVCVMPVSQASRRARRMTAYMTTVESCSRTNQIRWSAFINFKAYGCLWYMQNATACKVQATFFFFWVIFCKVWRNSMSFMFPSWDQLSERQTLWLRFCPHSSCMSERKRLSFSYAKGERFTCHDAVSLPVHASQRARRRSRAAYLSMMERGRGSQGGHMRCGLSSQHYNPPPHTPDRTLLKLGLRWWLCRLVNA